jgi:hypothetical protein
MLPKFLQPETWPYASVEVIPAVSNVERTIEEAQRDAFHTFLTDPATGPKLDAMLADNAAVDAALVDDRDDRDEDCGSQCGAGCGYCGRCS